MAETLINKTQAGEGIWTQDNLVAGTNISITQVPQPVIDEHTTALWHFDDSLDNALSGGDAFWNKTTSYVSGKFGKGLYHSAGGYSSGINFPVYTTQQDFTIDFWFHVLPEQNQFGIGISGSSSSGEVYFQTKFIIRTPSQVYQVDYPSGTDIYDWTHCAIVNDFSNTKTYWFINGKKVFELASNHYSLQDNSRLYYYGCLDEVRVSNVARWTSDFTPYTEPYGPAGATQYQINNTQDISSKQDAISDLATIRSGAAAGATAVQPSQLASVATSGSYNDLSNKPTIPDVTTKADTDLSNVSATGTSTGASWAMPSSTKTAITVGASGATYQAPANGWFSFETTNTATQVNYTYLRNETAHISFYAMAYAYVVARGSIEVKKGDFVSLEYFSSIISEFYFIYADGSKSEAN